jgi:hypothetical protein
MDTEAFIRWALDDARTVEERFTVELLVEKYLDRWHWKHKTGVQSEPWEHRHERVRQRKLNPAYEPHYTEENLRRALEIAAGDKGWECRSGSDDRPARSIELLRFLPHMEEVSVNGEVEDVSPLLALPGLRKLNFCCPGCEDLRFLDALTTLRELSLGLGCHWPLVGDFSVLDELETFHLSGNLLALPKGWVWPKVRTGTLSCSPLAARALADLPVFPACEFLTLSGVERLDGIEAFPLLRNLTLTGPVRDFTPLTALRNLTCLTYNGALPLDVSPLALLPKLHYASFHTSHVWGLDNAAMLRDYGPLAASPSLRELHVTGCPPLELEVAAINATLPPCDDLFLAEKPRPIPQRARMVIAPMDKHPQRTSVPHREPGEPDLVDKGVRYCEGRWVKDFVQQYITRRVGHSDWGSAGASGEYCSVSITIECYEVVERLEEILDALREAIARLRRDYSRAFFMIALRVPPPKPTEAQAKLMQQFRADEDKADFERRKQENQDHLERLYLYKLKKEEGDKIDPKEFAAPAPTPQPPPPWESEEDDDDDDSGDIAVKKKPEPPPLWFDDDHPLADNYRLAGTVMLDEIWFYAHFRDIAIHLMRREPDVEIPEEKKDEK